MVGAWSTSGWERAESPGAVHLEEAERDAISADRYLKGGVGRMEPGWTAGSPDLPLQPLQFWGSASALSPQPSILGCTGRLQGEPCQHLQQGTFPKSNIAKASLRKDLISLMWLAAAPAKDTHSFRQVRPCHRAAMPVRPFQAALEAAGPAAASPNSAGLRCTASRVSGLCALHPHCFYSLPYVQPNEAGCGCMAARRSSTSCTDPRAMLDSDAALLCLLLQHSSFRRGVICILANLPAPGTAKREVTLFWL